MGPGEAVVPARVGGPRPAPAAGSACPGSARCPSCWPARSADAPAAAPLGKCSGPGGRPASPRTCGEAVHRRSGPQGSTWHWRPRRAVTAGPRAPRAHQPRRAQGCAPVPGALGGPRPLLSARGHTGHLGGPWGASVRTEDPHPGTSLVQARAQHPGAQSDPFPIRHRPLCAPPAGKRQPPDPLLWKVPVPETTPSPVGLGASWACPTDSHCRAPGGENQPASRFCEGCARHGGRGVLLCEVGADTEHMRFKVRAAQLRGRDLGSGWGPAPAPRSLQGPGGSGGPGRTAQGPGRGSGGGGDEGTGDTRQAGATRKPPGSRQLRPPPHRRTHAGGRGRSWTLRPPGGAWPWGRLPRRPAQGLGRCHPPAPAQAWPQQPRLTLSGPGDGRRGPRASLPSQQPHPGGQTCAWLAAKGGGGPV